MKNPETIIQQLVTKYKLQPHPEGGFYKETYRSKGSIPKAALSDGFAGDRNFSTAIYFLLTAGNFSAFHRIQQDEVWHFYDGEPLEVHVIDTEGNYHCQELHNDLESAGIPQFTVPAGCWFASCVKGGGSYSFVGCTVAPGFDFADFELAKRESLANEYPQYKTIIHQLTRS
ncbi:cupin domain-containing protein [Flavobacteriaceae bacterium M23B6Z8]